MENTTIHNKPQKSKLLPKTQTPRGFYGLSFCIFCWHHSSNQWTESQRRTLCTFAGGSSFTAEWSAWGTTYMVVQSLSFIQILFQGSRCRHPLRSKVSPKISMITKSAQKIQKLQEAEPCNRQYLAFPLPKPLKPAKKAICFICWYLERENQDEQVASTIMMAEVSTKKPVFLDWQD